MKKKEKSQQRKKWMYLMGVICIISVLAVAGWYINYTQKSLFEHTITNVLTVTHQQQQAFDNFIARDEERIRSYVNNFSKHSSTDIDNIWNKLEAFTEVEAIYTVINIDTGEYYSNTSSEVLQMSEKDLESRRSLPDVGVRESMSLYTNEKMFGYYERFTFDDGVMGLFEKEYTFERVSEEFTLSFYNDQGFTYLINNHGDILLRPVDNENDYILENIFDMIDEEQVGTKQFAAMKDALSEQGMGYVTLRDDTQKRDYVCTYVPIEHVDGWYLVSIVSKDAIVTEADHVINTTQTSLVITVVVMAALVMLVIFMWQANKDLMQKEQEKNYKEQQFNILANYLASNTQDAYLMLKDDKCSIEYASPNFERVFGAKPEDSLTELNILKPEDNKLDGMKDGDSLEPVGVQRTISHSGEQKWFEETVYCAHIQGEKKFIIYISDRTKEREVQDSLKMALEAARGANQAKSTFLSSVSHDIRTPMNAIIGLVMLLQQDADNPRNVLDYAKKIDASSQHLLGLINDVLDMNKIESGNLVLNTEGLNLAEVIEGINNIIRPQVKAKGQSMDIYTSGFRHEHLVGDRTRINQIFINILSNAVKYTPEGGRIEMAVEELPQLSEEFARIQFRVKDNGQGMSEEYLKVIFEPFTREKNSMINEIQGTGLGMAITKNLVDLMGGTLSVESKLNEGSVFTVELNLRIQEQEDDSKFWKKHGITRIIVADDDEDICKNVVHVMSERGVVVDYVTDGKEVIDTIKKARERGEPYDLMLLDWQMPRLSGLEVAQLVRKNYPDKLPILLFTAYDWSDIEKEAIAVGIDHFMPKPFFISTFTEAIKRVRHKAVKDSAVIQRKESVMDGKHILIVEDNKINRFVLQKILTTCGATFGVAENGQEAVDQFDISKPGEYDFVLMDVKMPVMDGYEATRAIRAGNHPCAKTIPIIAMTANAFADDVKDALDAGMDAHVAKPIILDQLEKTIKEVLDKKAIANSNIHI